MLLAHASCSSSSLMLLCPCPLLMLLCSCSCSCSCSALPMLCLLRKELERKWADDEESEWSKYLKEERLRKAREKEAVMVPIVLPGGPEELSEYDKIRDMKSHAFAPLLMLRYSYSSAHDPLPMLLCSCSALVAWDGVGKEMGRWWGEWIVNGANIWKSRGLERQERRKP